MTTVPPEAGLCHPTRIIIGDDHPLVLGALCGAMQEVWPELEVVQCLTLAEVTAAADRAKHHVDLILLDVRMPGANGLDGLTALLARYPATPLLAISGYGDPDIIRRILGAGASGFISKNMELEEMLLAITKVLQGEIWAPEIQRETGPAHESSEAERARRIASLSAQQLRILRRIMEGRLNKEIAAELNIAEQTVKIHVSNIFRKLGVRTRTQAAVAAQDVIAPDG
ncbi:MULTISPECIES: response regulator transcription factor [Rhodomicrobium]|uniref:response regulator transcription factor n=1 Tax=Rhodomicrobium TaxID=1068 RepID=UPI000B4B9C58|nr:MULTISPECIES: response regulator transcription factor [Rhodomicrobium]